MTARPDILKLLFSGKGRLARGPFLVVAAILIGLLTVYETLVWPPARWVTWVPVYALAVWVASCILSKRLHDRGRTGWWAALILIAAVAVWPAPVGFFDFLGGLVLIWAAIELGAMPGEQGTNHNGPNPARSRAGMGAGAGV
ncbi:MAG: DUF805 domain-containing protein [Caulobacteraceae bacterium]